MLLCRQVPRVAQIVSDIKLHERRAHETTRRLARLD